MHIKNKKNNFKKVKNSIKSTFIHGLTKIKKFIKPLIIRRIFNEIGEMFRRIICFTGITTVLFFIGSRLQIVSKQKKFAIIFDLQ